MNVNIECIRKFHYLSFFTFFSYCNTTHENVIGSTKRIVQIYLPELFQPNLLCAGYESSEQGSCKGDSGGPLMFYKTGTFKCPTKANFQEITDILLS